MPKIPDNLLVCPKCRKGLLGWGSARKDGLRCRLCEARFSFKNGVIDLIDVNPCRRSISQFFMEAPPIIKIYESRYWRRSPHFSFITGIDFDDEVQLILEAGKPEPESSLLDLACGPGIYSRILARRLSSGLVVGLDISRPMLEHAAKLARKERINNLIFLWGNAMDLPFENGFFNNVNCCGALHLFPDRKKALSEIIRVLAPGGCFTVAMVRIPDSLAAGLPKTMLNFLGIKGFSEKELKEVLENSGFENISVKHSERFWQIFSARKPEN